MNQRIRELWEQCKTYDWNLNRPTYTYDHEKFAELIIRECADVAKETRWAVPPSQEQIARGIQQHFGVEE